MSPTTNATVVLQSTVDPTEENALRYDYSGAMYFTVAVVLIYGLSIVALIATHMKGEGRDAKEESRQVSRYFHDRDQMERKGELDRLMWLQSKVHIRPDSSGVESSSGSENSYLIDSPDTDWKPQYYTCLSQTTAPNSSELSLILEEDVFVQPGNAVLRETVPCHLNHLPLTRIPHESCFMLHNEGHKASRPTDLPIRANEESAPCVLQQIANTETSKLTENLKTHVGNQTVPKCTTVQKMKGTHNELTDRNSNSTAVVLSQTTHCATDTTPDTPIEYVWKLRSDVNC